MIRKLMVLVAVVLVLGGTYLAGVGVTTASVRCSAEDVVLVNGATCVHVDELDMVRVEDEAVTQCAAEDEVVVHGGRCVHVDELSGEGVGSEVEGQAGQ